MNPLVIRIAADLKAFKANMAEMKVQLETNASAMKRMSSSFDGSKIIGDANAMVIALAKMGGATKGVATEQQILAGAAKLNEAEMQRVNRAVTEAIEKYRLLGSKAPPEMLSLRDATAKVNVETAKTPPLVSGMESRFTALGVAAGTFLGNMAWSAVNKLGQELGEFAKRGIQLNAVQSSFERLAQSTNQSSSEMLSSMQRASRGLVAEFDLMKAANKAMLLGLPVTSESMGTLAKAATTLGRAMGQDATKSVDDLITALGRSSPMILDNLGITVKVGEANEVYAAKLGKTVEQLTDAEKKTAFYEEAMRKANDKTKELGESTKTLGERLQTAWVSIGNVVTEVVSEYNIGIGAALTNTKSFGQFLSIAMTQGLGAAVSLFSEMERGRAVVEQLTASEKLAAAALFKKGETVQQVAKFLGESEKVVQAYADSLKKVVPAAGGAGASLNRATKEVNKFKMSLPGVTEAVDVKQFFDSLRIGGNEFVMSLPGVTAKMDDFVSSIRVGTDQIESYMMQLPGVAGQSAAEFVAELQARNDDLRSVGARWADSLGSSFGKALEGLGSVIVGAIQGGGDIGRAALASIGASMGNDLGAAIAKGIGGQMGKILGGFAGPLGALLGSGIGGLVDKLFGKNQGRDSIKAFFKEFKGGADELRALLLALGEEGDQLWIRLTQNARGPAQVAAAIKAVEDAFTRAEAKAKALRDEIARVSSEGGVISAALKEWLSTNASDPEAQAFILGQVKVAGTAIGRMLEAMERAAKAVGKEFTLTAGGAKAMSLILLAAWDGTAQGLRDMAPDIERLRAALERSGVDGGKAFAQLSKMAKLASDAITGPMLEAINHGTAALVAMYNSGFLTQEVFQGLVDEIMLQRDALLKTGATADTVNAAMRNDLQKIWELVKDGKFAVDEKTAALLKEAEAQGVVGDKFRSSTDRMVIALERLVKIFTQGGDSMSEVVDRLGNKMVHTFETRMVDAARNGAKQVQDILNGIKMSEVVVAVRTVIAGSAPSVSGATAPTSSWDRFSRSAPLPTLRTSSAAPTVITVISTLDGKAVAQNQVKYIPRELDFIGARR